MLYVGRVHLSFRGCLVNRHVYFFIFFMENPVSKNVDPVQIPHVASDLDLQSLPFAHLRVSRLE